ncbi:MAG: hypothetical protein JXJ20_10865 [Anaerolineae bacterium]|nr:hypothetical protein [Anaerolineae bacterium]
MDSAPEFLDLFIEPTGELIYFLAVIAISLSALLMALGQRMRGSSERAAGRYTVLLSGVVLAWIALMGGALYVLITDTADEAVLPPLERAVNTLVIIFSSTALLAADSERPPRGLWVLVVLLSLGLIGAYAYTANAWYPLADNEDFNKHTLGFVWTFGPGLILILATALLLTRYKETADIPLKLVFFLVLLLGYSYTTARISGKHLDGHTSGALRLSFLAAMPMIATIVYRLVIERLSVAIDEVSEYAEAISRPQAAISIPDQSTLPSRRLTQTAESTTLLKAMGIMLENEDPANIPRQIVVAVTDVIKADVAVLISHEDSGWADIIAAYDSVQERQIPGLALNLDEQPTMTNAIERKMQRPLYADRNQDELVDLYTRLDIGQVGPAYVQPLTRAGDIVGVLIVAMPYSDRELQAHQTNLLEGLGPIAARLLTLSRAAQRARFTAEDQAIQAIVEGAVPDQLDEQSVSSARQEMQASLELAQQQIGELSRLVRDLQVELDYERSRMAQVLEDDNEGLTISQRIEALSHERKELAAERELLSQALQEAQATLLGATAESNQDVYTTMIETLRRERDDLQVQKLKLERNLDDIRSAKDQAVPEALREMLTELSEDKAKLTNERNQIKAELEEVHQQLRSLGIEGGPLALAKTLAQITEERTHYRAQAEKIAKERDRLLAERAKLSDQLEHEKEREIQLEALQANLRRLATDREALIKQRDTLRIERDELVQMRDDWLGQRARLMGELTGIQAELEDMNSDLAQANTVYKRESETRAQLEAERDRLIAERTAIQTERDQLLARVEGNRELLEQLGADGVGTLKDMIDELTAERQELENKLLQAQQDLAQLDREYGHLSDTAALAAVPVRPENADVLLSIAQELRTPMSSIMGYTDLLLSESVGILGALQRQFLQRVQANIKRLNTLIEDLVSITALDSDDFKLQPVTVDMLEVLEDAITKAGVQFREKNITLHMNLANTIPPLHADRDAMHQVIVQLLSNAYLASPADGDVTITARHERHFMLPDRDDLPPSSDPINGIFVSVTDQGGGVSPDEQRRVFGRLYRADNPLIEGLGDTGVGLSIAKALVEAHKGSIWLDSEPGKGSTFQFIVPFRAQHVIAEETNA